MAPHLGRQGIVIGAGMAGMPSARVLADYFDQVIVLESDKLPVDASPRPGTPQSKHLHVLLAGGQQALSTLFPSFEGSLAAAGAQLLSVTTDYWMELPRYEVFPQRDLGIRTYSLTRPLVERVVRGKVTAIRNIEIRERCRAQRLVTTEDGAAVNGVVCTHSSGETEEIPADLVIDASGSGQLTLNLLAALGLQGPEVSTVGVEVGYSTTIFEIPDDASPNWGGRCFGLWSQMPGLGASQLELPLEIGEGDIDVAHGHTWIDVAEQFHQDGEADPGAKHLGGVGMPELVGDDTRRESERVADLMKVVAELNEQSHFASRAR